MYGTLLFVGADGYKTSPNVDPGRVYVYEYNGVTWDVTPTIIDVPDSSTEFGNAIDYDGSRLIVGCLGVMSGFIKTGSAFVFVRSGSDWTSPTLLDVPLVSTNSGVRVAIRGDRAVVGSKLAANTRGELRGYTLTGSNTWTRDVTFGYSGTGTSTNDYFGWSLSLNEFGLSVGIPGRTVSGSSRAGYINFYKYTTTSYLSSVRVSQPSQSTNERFGTSVVVFGEYKVVSGDGTRRNVYVYKGSGTAWVLQETFTSTSSGFGKVISFGGNTLYIGDTSGNVVEYYVGPPTASPTLQPTNKPTLQPTNKPTLQPTDQPTNKPTVFPTLQPTLQPTNKPTLIPTLQPTNKPTLQPTNKPTVFPTGAPTFIPTLQPTNKPTVVPTLQPTFQPTLQPTNKPTVFPTVIPTLQPTLQPTNKPTVFPTVIPTNKPTNIPTTSPTGFPTGTPTMSPSLAPTGSPTLAPTGSPTPTPRVRVDKVLVVRVPDPIERLNATRGLIERSAAGVVDDTERISINVKGDERVTIRLGPNSATNIQLREAVKASLCGFDTTCVITFVTQRTAARRLLRRRRLDEVVTIRVRYEVDSSVYSSFEDWASNQTYADSIASILGVNQGDVEFVSSGGTITLTITLTQDIENPDQTGDVLVSEIEALAVKVSETVEDIGTSLGLETGDITGFEIDRCGDRTCYDRGICNNSTGRCSCVGSWRGANCEVPCVCEHSGFCRDGYCKCLYPWYGYVCEIRQPCNGCV